MEKMGWTDLVNNEVLHSVRKDRNILHTVKKKRQLTGLATPCIETAFNNVLLKEKYKEG
jgi:hypothetical protein